MASHKKYRAQCTYPRGSLYARRMEYTKDFIEGAFVENVRGMPLPRRNDCNVSRL